MARVIAAQCRDDTAARGRWAGALAAALLGATAFVLALVAAVFAEPIPVAHLGAETESLVRRYYAALNTALTTGDLATLEQVVAADARLSPASGDQAPTRAALAGNLAVLRAAQPNLRIVVERVVADRDEAVAWVSLAGVAEGSPIAMPVVGSASELLDGFRVRGGQIAELWGATPGLSAPAPVIQTDLDPVSGPLHIGLVRLEMAPGAETPFLSGPGPTAISVAIGTLQAQKDDDEWLPEGQSQGGARTEHSVSRMPSLLEPGDRLVVAAATPFRLRNHGRETAVALLAAVFPSAIVNAPPLTFDNAGLEVRSLLVEMVRSPHPPLTPWLPQGIVVQRLAGHLLTDVPYCPLRLDVQRMALPRGTEAAGWRPTKPVVLAAEHGAVVVTVAPTAWGVASRSVVLAGDASAIDPGARVGVRGADDDSAAVIVLSLQASPTSGLPNGRVPCLGAAEIPLSGPR